MTLNDLEQVIDHYKNSNEHNDLLFIAMLLTGFFASMRLGELTLPDDPSIHDLRKVTRRSTVVLQPDQFEFHLPAHKADRYFEGNGVIIQT